METKRRTFIGTMAGLLAWPFVKVPETEAEADLLTNPYPYLVVLPPDPAPFLKDWMSADRTPIMESEDPVERFLIRALRLNEPVLFQYLGGTDAGRMRRVRPVLLYRVQGYRTAYVTGYCEERGEIRTFRLDRVVFP